MYQDKNSKHTYEWFGIQRQCYECMCKFLSTFIQFNELHMYCTPPHLGVYCSISHFAMQREMPFVSMLGFSLILVETLLYYRENLNWDGRSNMFFLPTTLWEKLIHGAPWIRFNGGESRLSKSVLDVRYGPDFKQIFRRIV